MINTNLIPPPKNVAVIDYEDGNTNNIIDVMLRRDKDGKNGDFTEFSAQFPPNKKGMKKLWDFVRNSIRYKVDPMGEQNIKRPSALYHSGFGDCKSKTLFITEVLRCLGISYTIRFASYDKSKTVTHVYPIAHLGKQNIIIDSVYSRFDREEKYTYKEDYMTRISTISGFKNIIQEQEEREKQVPEAPYIPYGSITAGEAKMLLLARKFEIKAVMQPRNAKIFAAAKTVIDKALKSDEVPNFPEGLEYLKEVIEGYKNDRRPALDPFKTLTYRVVQPARQAIEGTWNSNRTVYTDANGEPFSFPMDPCSRYIEACIVLDELFFQDGVATYGAGTEFQKTWAQIGLPMCRLLVDMAEENIIDSTGNIISYSFRQALTGQIITLNKRKIRGIRSGNTFLESDSSTFLDAQALFNILNAAINSVSPGGQTASSSIILEFANKDFKNEFKARYKIMTGIPEAFLNNLFRESKGVGNAVIYDFIKKMDFSQDLYPDEVLRKRLAHGTWVASCVSLTGLQSDVVEAAARNTIVFKNGGKEPEELLTELVVNWNEDRIGDPALIIAIITLIVKAVATAIVAMSNARRKAEEFEQIVPETFAPLAPVLEPVNDDWENGNNGGDNGGRNDGDNDGSNNKNLLGGLLAAGGLYLYFSE